MNWTEFWNEIISTEPGLIEICLRLACAMLVGLVIGTEREYTHRPAGMRTHILVALGACVISITGELMFHQYTPLGGNADPARLSAQVVTGVGFLGAGTIMREGFSVKGLTTAASVWAVACLGIAAGFGYYALAVFGMVFIFVTLTIFEWIQQKLVIKSPKKLDYILQTRDITASLSRINELAQINQVSVQNLTATAIKDGHELLFHAEFSGRHVKKHRVAFFEGLCTAPETKACHRAGDITYSGT